MPPFFLSQIVNNKEKWYSYKIKIGIMISRRKELENIKMGTKVALLGIINVSILALAKLIIGLYTGMIVLVADALSSFADLLGLFATLIGLKISTKSAGKGSSYGFYKVETLASLTVAIILLYLGIEIFIKSIERLFIVGHSKAPLLGVLMVMVSTLMSYKLAKKLKNTGKKINSLALINCGKDKTIDMYVQVVVLIGILANYFSIPYLEGVIGMLISLLTLKEGVFTGKESLFYLLDFYRDDKLVKKIKKSITTNSTVIKKVLEIKLRRAGTVVFGEAILELNPFSGTTNIRNELIKIKSKIIGLDEYLKDFSLLITIPKPTKIRMAFPVTNTNGLKSKIAENMTETKAYVFVDVNDKKILNVFTEKIFFKENDFYSITKYLTQKKVNIIINNDMHSLFYYNLRHLNNINVYPKFGNINNVETAVKILKIDL